MDILHESEHFRGTVVRASIRGEHIIPPPSMRPRAEYRDRSLSVKVKVICLDEHGVGVHVDIAEKTESLCLRVVPSNIALDDLAILIPERPSVTEDGDTICCVIVQVPRPERVPVFILKLYQTASELRETTADIIIQIITRENSPVLDDPHMTNSLDDIGIDIPQGGVANQFCGVMLETGVPESLSEAVAVHLLQLKLVTPEKAHKTVCPLRELGLGYQREQNKKDGIRETAKRHYTYSLNFEVQMERWNSQSLNMVIPSPYSFE